MKIIQSRLPNIIRRRKKKNRIASLYRSELWLAKWVLRNFGYLHPCFACWCVCEAIGANMSASFIKGAPGKIWKLSLDKSLKKEEVKRNRNRRSANALWRKHHMYLSCVVWIYMCLWGTVSQAWSQFQAGEKRSKRHLIITLFFRRLLLLDAFVFLSVCFWKCVIHACHLSQPGDTWILNLNKHLPLVK